MKDPTKHTYEDVLADLEASDAELDAGLMVPGEVVHAAIDRLEARLAGTPQRKPFRAGDPV
jgi:hypothetical protein